MPEQERCDRDMVNAADPINKKPPTRSSPVGGFALVPSAQRSLDKAYW
jgi:hypothetical protein